MHTESDGQATSFADTGLYYRAVAPEGEVRGSLLIVHGYGEHGGRYLPFMHRLAEAGWKSLAFDHRGHGRSEGLKGFLLRSTHAIRDIAFFVHRLREEHPDRPIVLFGQSMGAALVVRHAALPDSGVDGIIASSMYLKNTEPVSRALIAVARLLDYFVPALAIRPFDVTLISRDPEVISAYVADPLVYHGAVRVRTGLELISNYLPVREAAPKIRVPALLLHGTADRLADPGTTPEIFELLGTGRKLMKLYEGCHHELLNEPEAQEVTSDIIAWLDEHFPAKTARPPVRNR